MADRLGMDPVRIERLRSPERLEYFDPDRIDSRLVSGLKHSSHRSSCAFYDPHELPHLSSDLYQGIRWDVHVM